MLVLVTVSFPHREDRKEVNEDGKLHEYNNNYLSAGFVLSYVLLVEVATQKEKKGVFRNYE